MTTNDALDTLLGERMLVLDVELEPAGSPTIQVTTFANTGPSFYVDREGRLSAVVDSVASMANQLEATVWDELGGQPVEAVAPLPWVRVLDGGDRTSTTSRTAAHRLNAHSIMSGAVDGTGELFETMLSGRLGEPTPPIARPLADEVWSLDPLAILHGVWFAGIWDGRARMPRALSGRIDAHDVQTQSVQVGGQKTADTLEEIEHRQRGAEGKTVAGEVPHHTSEVSAACIVARLLLDVRLLRSYGLGEAREHALAAVGLLQIAELLAAWPRRRSRCALEVAEVTVRRPEGFVIPAVDELRAATRALCSAATGSEADADPVVVRFSPKKAASDE